MAMGKRRRRPKQTSMWVTTQDLPRTAAHPFYTRLKIRFSTKRISTAPLRDCVSGSTPTRSAAGSQLITLVQRSPPLVDGAFIIIAWVGTKLALEYLHAAWEIGYAFP